MAVGEFVCGARMAVAELPDDVLRQCLVRVPVRWHASLQRVSREVRALVQSAEYYEQRRAEGVSSALVCMLQREGGVFGVTVLDLETMAWERLPAVPGLAGGLPTFARLVAVGGELVVLGGWWPDDRWEVSRAVLVFNFSSQRWRRGADMTSARSLFACGAVGGGRVLVAGGHDGDKKALASAEVYDVAADSWSSVKAMRMERDEPIGVAMADEGRFSVVSGYGSEAQGEFSTSGEVYDTATDSWRFVERMWTRAAANASPGSMAAMAGQVYGVDGKEVVVYSPERNAWTVVAQVPEDICEKGELTSSSITAVGNSLVITGLVKKNDVAALRTLRLSPGRGSCKAQWQTVPCNDQFSSLAQTTCAFEL